MLHFVVVKVKALKKFLQKNWDKTTLKMMHDSVDDFRLRIVILIEYEGHPTENKKFQLVLSLLILGLLKFSLKFFAGILISWRIFKEQVFWSILNIKFSLK